jgi:hypothetical protein
MQTFFFEIIYRDVIDNPDFDFDALKPDFQIWFSKYAESYP